MSSLEQRHAARKPRSTTFRWTFAIALLPLVTACVRHHCLIERENPNELAGETAALRSSQVEAHRLDGQPLLRPRLTGKHRTELESNFRAAVESHAPDDEESVIWLGRRAAYLGHYRSAHEIFTRGLEAFPDSPELLRHRGHRRLSLRDWRAAVEDLSRAARLIAWQADEIEPDGAPNAAGIPRSTLQSNIWYHLGLAHFLLGEFEAAESAYWPGLEVSRVNDDMLCATSYWLYLSLMRQGKTYSAAAVLEPIHAEMDVIENFSYHNLLLMYKGEIGIETVRQELGADSIQNATLGFGIANGYLHEGDTEAALQTLRAIVEKENWASFAYMAAEAELDRMGALP